MTYLTFPHSIPMLPQRGERLLNRAPVLEVKTDLEHSAGVTYVLCITNPKHVADRPAYAIWRRVWADGRLVHGQYFNTLTDAMDEWLEPFEDGPSSSVSFDE